MSIFALVERAARSYRHRRALRQTEHAIAGLPYEVRKDIGWPEPARTRVAAQLRDFGW